MMASIVTEKSRFGNIQETRQGLRVEKKRMEVYIYLTIVAFLAGFIQGLSGFGSVLLSLPLMVLFLDIREAIPLVNLMGVILTVLLIIQLRAHWEWGKIWPLLAGALPGIPVGVYLLKRMDSAHVQIILGLVLAAYSVYGLLFRLPIGKVSGPWAYFFGFFAGGLGGAISASGPPVIVYTSLQAWTKDQIKVTLQGFFIVSGLLIGVFHAANGLTTDGVIRNFLVSIPTLLIGTWAGSLLYGKFKEEGYRRVMLVLLGALGVFTLVRVF
jgi:uncharacterized membrane protein YfcA